MNLVNFPFYLMNLEFPISCNEFRISRYYTIMPDVIILAWSKLTLSQTTNLDSSKMKGLADDNFKLD